MTIVQFPERGKKQKTPEQIKLENARAGLLDVLREQPGELEEAVVSNVLHTLWWLWANNEAAFPWQKKSLAPQMNRVRVFLDKVRDMEAGA